RPQDESPEPAQTNHLGKLPFTVRGQRIGGLLGVTICSGSVGMHDVTISIVPKALYSAREIFLASRCTAQAIMPATTLATINQPLWRKNAACGLWSMVGIFSVDSPEITRAACRMRRVEKRQFAFQKFLTPDEQLQTRGFKAMISKSSAAGFSLVPANPAKSIHPPCGPAQCRRGQTPCSECRLPPAPPHRRRNPRPPAGPGQRCVKAAGPAAVSGSFPA